MELGVNTSSWQVANPAFWCSYSSNCGFDNSWLERECRARTCSKKKYFVFFSRTASEKKSNIIYLTYDTCSSSLFHSNKMKQAQLAHLTSISNIVTVNLKQISLFRNHSTFHWIQVPYLYILRPSKISRKYFLMSLVQRSHKTGKHKKLYLLSLLI